MYLLDTNVCIYIINNDPGIVVEKIRKLKPHQVKLSAISVGELEYGVAKSRNREKNRNALLHFASALDILPFDDNDAEVFGMIWAVLESRGEVIGPYDMQIAAQAVARDLVLVTDNIIEFGRIPNMHIENWIQ